MPSKKKKKQWDIPKEIADTIPKELLELLQDPEQTSITQGRLFFKHVETERSRRQFIHVAKWFEKYYPSFYK